MKLLIFCSFGLKTPIRAPKIGVFGDFTPKMGSNVNGTPKIGVFGDFTPKMGSNVNGTPKRHIVARVRVVLAIKRENP